MKKLINIYCDESCHLENDKSKSMALGCIWCPKEKSNEINRYLRDLKQKSGLSQSFETKWVKVSPGKIDYYLSMVNYFFDNNDLHFRVLIIPNKSLLDHEKYKQSHNTFYYKMYFEMLKIIINPTKRYRIYLDIKDTWGGLKTQKLHEILCNSIYDFPHEIIEKIQIVRSSEIEILQLCDLLLGAMGAVSREITKSPAKLEVIKYIHRRSGYQLTHTTLIQEPKFNIFYWSPKENN